MLLPLGAHAAEPGARPAEPAEAKITGTLSCDRASEPGRVRCSVEAHAAGARSIAWADVALVELPEFAAALKGRIGPADATFHDAGVQRWAFGLVAKKAGDGEVKARVRAVVCDPVPGDAGAPKCAPTILELRGKLHVGS